MRVFIALDLVDCSRFATWFQLSDKALRKVFSPTEITYCHSEPAHSASRFAVRFAAREALYKALNPLLLYDMPMPFLLFCRSVEVIKSPTGTPTFKIEREALAPFYDITAVAEVSLSLSHTPTTAGAVVVVVTVK